MPNIFFCQHGTPGNFVNHCYAVGKLNEFAYNCPTKNSTLACEGCGTEGNYSLISAYNFHNFRASTVKPFTPQSHILYKTIDVDTKV